MRRGLIAELRALRRWIAQAVAVVLILPALLTLLPQPALSAAAALEQDLLSAVCGQDGSRQGGAPQHQTSHDHCVLCSSNCPSCSPGLLTAAPAFAALPPPPARPQDGTAQAIAPPLRALLDASPPRGPPRRA